MVATTAVIASSSGMPAAMSAPKETSRISRVIGREVVPAFARSALKTSWNSFSELAEPDCSMRRSGCAFAAASTVATEASTALSTAASSADPGISNVTSTAWPSGDTEPPWSGP
jgi:hypothetical protein